MLRPAARVLLLSPDDRVLLFRVALDGVRPRPLWITPGGGCLPGESFEDAALRELWEETGVRDVALGPCVWSRRHIFEFQRTWLDEVERVFVVRLEVIPAITTANFEPHEVTFMPEHRWWAVDEIAASADWFAPRKLSTLLPAIIEGRYPSEPVDSGV